MREDLPHRYVNEGFSGGEKKRNEILQMKMLKPKFALLDEIDSGLDVDALRIVGENVNAMKSDDFGTLVITHYERLLDYLDIDKVHIFILVEDEFHITIQDDDMNDIETVKDIVELVVRKIES